MKNDDCACADDCTFADECRNDDVKKSEERKPAVLCTPHNNNQVRTRWIREGEAERPQQFFYTMA